MHKKSISNTTILSIIAIIIIAMIFLFLIKSFSKRVEKTEEASSINKCKLPGTNNYCCEPYSADEITPKKGGWVDCEKPLSACCIG